MTRNLNAQTAGRRGRRGTTLIEAIAMVALVAVLMLAGTEALNLLRRWQQVPDGGALDRACDRLRADAAIGGVVASDQAAVAFTPDDTAAPPALELTVGGIPWAVRDAALVREGEPLCPITGCRIAGSGAMIELTLRCAGLPERRLKLPRTLLPPTPEAGHAR